MQRLCHLVFNLVKCIYFQMDMEEANCRSFFPLLSSLMEYAYGIMTLKLDTWKDAPDVKISPKYSHQFDCQASSLLACHYFVYPTLWCTVQSHPQQKLTVFNILEANSEENKSRRRDLTHLSEITLIPIRMNGVDLLTNAHTSRDKLKDSLNISIYQINL